MAEKFYVVQRVAPDDTNAARSSWMKFVGGPYTTATEARGEVHKSAESNPGVTYTIIKVIGHAVADLVRDIEP